MENQVIFFGWNRTVPGREQIAVEDFQEFLGYMSGLQESGAIASFEPILLMNHGGDLNGFILIRGSSEQLNTLTETEQWLIYNTRAGYYLEGTGTIRGVSGDRVMDWLGIFGKVLEKYA